MHEDTYIRAYTVYSVEAISHIEKINIGKDNGILMNVPCYPLV